MRLRVMSDVHVELHADAGRAFVESLPDADCDALVLAGDVCTVPGGLLTALSLFCRRFPRVVYVAGNHEFWRSERGRVRAALRRACELNPGLSVLDDDVVRIGGQRVVGTTLWFPDSPAARMLSHDWSDFIVIPGLQKWLDRRSQGSARFLEREVRPGDVVVTHYLPSWKSVHPRWARESSNCFFVHDLEPLILERRPALWIHGHTHESMDYSLGQTRVVCNPFGYVPAPTNPSFDPGLVVEL